MIERKEINKCVSEKEFLSFYYTKDELVDFCNLNGISKIGTKEEVQERICLFLKYGVLQSDTPKLKAFTFSKFDWNNEILNDETIITDNYKNTENVRKWFINKIGKRFRFNTKFMNIMKISAGITLHQASVLWLEIENLKKHSSCEKKIPRVFKYNRYVKAFLTDNPHLTLQDAVKSWNLNKKQQNGFEYKSRNEIKK